MYTIPANVHEPKQVLTRVLVGHLPVDLELLLGGGLEVALVAPVGAPPVVRVANVGRQVRQAREPHAADRARRTALCNGSLLLFPLLSFSLKRENGMKATYLLNCINMLQVA